VFYSGTVSAAIEGCILGYQSAAISNYNYDSIDFSLAGEVALDIARKMLNHSLPSGTLLNINVPDALKEDIMGIKVTRMGVRKYVANYVEREDPRGVPYYWLAGEAVDDDEQDTDISAVSQKYISVTPIHYDLTKYALMDHVDGWFNQIDQSFGKDLSCDC
jgi:5'-nucleotidase